MRLFVGDDWAEGHHEVEVMDGAGKVLARKRLADDVQGIAQLHGLVGRFAGEDAGAAEVVVGIETGCGPWVAALVAAGCLVFAVNPLQAARFRERHGVSGAKSDSGDAHALADMVRADSRQLRPAAGDSPEAEGIKVLARTRETMIWEEPAWCSGCGTSCGSTSPPRWKPSGIWTPLTPWNCPAGHLSRGGPRS